MATGPPGVRHFVFQVVPDVFIDAAHLPRAHALPPFGLVDRPYETDQQAAEKPWKRFRDYVEHLNAKGPASTVYKVLFITRHGQGDHNVMESKVGTEEWDNYWSRLDGDGEVVWADAKLTATGMEQARGLGRIWCEAVSAQGVPLPGTVYTSPLARCLETTRLALSAAFAQEGVPFRPVVKERLRERLTDHACDRRSDRSWIAEHYPAYEMEPGFAERDPLWTGGPWETEAAHVARESALLSDIFAGDAQTFVSLTAHSYTAAALFMAVGLPPMQLDVGNTVALLVKAELSSL